MKIKTSELTGKALDFVVTRLEYPEWVAEGYLESVDDLVFDDGEVYAPSTDWVYGGPIIEREKLTVVYNERGDGPRGWRTIAFIESCMEYGPTPLIAAMRCYVASKLGDEVDVPEELK